MTEVKGKSGNGLELDISIGLGVDRFDGLNLDKRVSLDVDTQDCS
jgi:hypothetical protein